MQVKKRITDVMFEMKMRFHRMEPPATIPWKRARFVFGLPNHFNNTVFLYGIFECIDVFSCST